jgi:hypothetical protein
MLDRSRFSAGLYSPSLQPCSPFVVTLIGRSPSLPLDGHSFALASLDRHSFVVAGQSLAGLVYFNAEFWKLADLYTHYISPI